MAEALIPSPAETGEGTEDSRDVETVLLPDRSPLALGHPVAERPNLDPRPSRRLLARRIPPVSTSCASFANRCAT